MEREGNVVGMSQSCHSLPGCQARHKACRALRAGRSEAWLQGAAEVSHLPATHGPLQVLQSTRQLRMWGSDQPEATYYDLIAKDPDVVKVVLLLTGSLEGMKAATTDFLGGWGGVG